MSYFISKDSVLRDQRSTSGIDISVLLLVKFVMANGIRLLFFVNMTEISQFGNIYIPYS